MHTTDWHPDTLRDSSLLFVKLCAHELVGGIGMAALQLRADRYAAWNQRCA